MAVAGVAVYSCALHRKGKSSTHHNITTSHRAILTLKIPLVEPALKSLLSTMEAREELNIAGARYVLHTTSD